MKAENRHFTKVWKKKRKDHGADKCGNAKCLICHSSKVIGIPDRQQMRQNSKDKNQIQ